MFSLQGECHLIKAGYWILASFIYINNCKSVNSGTISPGIFRFLSARRGGRAVCGPAEISDNNHLLVVTMIWYSCSGNWKRKPCICWSCQPGSWRIVGIHKTWTLMAPMEFDGLMSQKNLEKTLTKLVWIASFRMNVGVNSDYFNYLSSQSERKNLRMSKGKPFFTEESRVTKSNTASGQTWTPALLNVSGPVGIVQHTKKVLATVAAGRPTGHSKRAGQWKSSNSKDHFCAN